MQNVSMASAGVISISTVFASTPSPSPSPSVSTTSDSPPSKHYNGFYLILLVLAVGLILGVALSVIALRRMYPRTLQSDDACVVAPELWEYVVVSDPGWADRAGSGWKDLLPLSASFLPDDRTSPSVTRRRSRNPLALFARAVVWLRNEVLTAMYGPDSRVGAMPPPAPSSTPCEPGHGKLQVAVAITMPGSDWWHSASMTHSNSGTSSKDAAELSKHMTEYCLGLAEIPWHVKHTDFGCDDEHESMAE